jgi:hypothetical protein
MVESASPNGFPAEAVDKPTVPNRKATTRIDLIRIAFIYLFLLNFKYGFYSMGSLNNFKSIHLLINYT